MLQILCKATIAGDAETVARATAQLGRPVSFTTDGETVQHDAPMFALHNIVPMPDSITTAEDRETWCRDNWGMCSDTFRDNKRGAYVVAATPTEVAFEFDHWGRGCLPEAAMEALARQHPGLTVTLEYNDEDWAGGEIEYRLTANGELDEEWREWYGPDTHAEWIERFDECLWCGGAKGDECRDEEEDEEVFCSDCGKRLGLRNPDYSWKCYPCSIIEHEESN